MTEQTRAARNALTALGYRRGEYRISAQGPRIGEYTLAHVRFVKRVPTFDEVTRLADAGFDVEVLMVSGNPVHVSARWIGHWRARITTLIPIDGVR